jgi:7,8-dihydropterin-6-yl-methyl-4-(beta-D-ribofuranosyl)aminobenzene 5'-phosphate synthase
MTAESQHQSVRVLSLVENTAERAGLLGEHGLAIWLEVGEQCVLWDTGQGLTILHNAHQLNVELHRAEAIVLSHGHYDHTGGLSVVLRQATQALVYACPEVCQRRFVRDVDGTTRDIGMPEAEVQAVRRRGIEFGEAGKPTEIVAGLYMTGAIPRRLNFENVGGRFVLDEAGRKADLIPDDQALFFSSPRGTVVLLGCAHAGLLNTLSYVQHLTGGEPIYCVLGGMHLRNASRVRLERSVEAIQQMNIACLRPAHCTGTRAITAFRNVFPTRCGEWSVGTEMVFGLQNPKLNPYSKGDAFDV